MGLGGLGGVVGLFGTCLGEQLCSTSVPSSSSDLDCLLWSTFCRSLRKFSPPLTVPLKESLVPSFRLGGGGGLGLTGGEGAGPMEHERLC